jgi:opacity protein-like surface antigen
MTRRILCVIAVAMCSTTAQAADAAPSDEWNILFDVYVWGASIGATTTAGDNIDVPIGDLLKHLDMMFMGSLGGRGGRWSVLADLIYLDLSATENSTANLIGRPINTSVDVGLTGTIINLVGGYTAVRTDEFTFDVVFGARYLSLDADLTFAVGPVNVPVSGSSNVWDGIIGVRGNADIAEKWFFSYYLDAGTGGTDFTWQTALGFGYKLPKLDVNFGYRYLEWDFADNDPGGDLFSDLEFHGPYAGVKFIFGRHLGR